MNRAGGNGEGPGAPGSPAPPERRRDPSTLEANPADAVVTGSDYQLRRADGGCAAPIDGLSPKWQAEPRRVSEVGSFMRTAAGQNLAIVPVGGGNFLNLGGPLHRYDTALLLGGLSRIVDYQPADMTITVEAGVRLTALADLLATRGQWLPIDPPMPEQQTVGGAIAAGLSGPCRVSQGRVRDLLLGLRIVRADGSVVKAGGRVVKNVAGYDLPKLYVGSLGSLGVVVEATMKIRPVPEVSRHVVIDTGGDLARAAELGLQVADQRLCPFALAAYSGPTPIAGSTCGLFVSCAGPAPQVSWQVDKLLQSAEAAGLRPREASPNEYQSLRDKPLKEAGEVAWRAALLPRLAGGFAAMMAEEIRAAEGEAPLSALVLPDSGSVWLSTSAVRPHEELAEMTARWRVQAVRAGGNLVLSRAPAALKRLVSVWGKWGGVAGLMRRMKRTLDPGGRLSPGRFGEEL